MAKLTIIRFDINSPDGYDVNRLPEGVKGNPQLMMWKELCRSGVYETNGVKHNIDRAFLQNIVDTFWERDAKGIEVPCPVGHTHDPESKRGRVVYVELREAKDGSVSLYGIIEFVSFEAKRMLCNSGVSIEAPEVVTDGDGETHKFGLEHVAFTDYPVVAGMDGFRDVVFSIYKKKEKKMGKKRKKFSDATAFDTCPNCGHEVDDVGAADDVVQSRRYGRRFADDTEMDDEVGLGEDEIQQSRRYGRRYGRRFDEEAQSEDDIVQGRRYGRRYGRRFADELDDDVAQSRRYGRRFADDAMFDDDAELDTCPNCGHEMDEDGVEDVKQSRRYGRRFADDEELPDNRVAQSRRYGRRFADDAEMDDEDVVQGRRYGRRYGRRFDEDAQLDDEEAISQSRRYGRRYGRRFDEDAQLDDEEAVSQSRRYGRRYGRRFDEDSELEDDIQQSRRYGRRYGRRFDEDTQLDDDIESDEETPSVQQSRRYGRRFADEVEYDELPANALAVEQEKRYGDKKFSLDAADTVSANILKENRELQIQNLLSSGKINRIQARQILDRFCNQNAISFSVSTGDNSEFKNVVELMKSGIGADYSEKTGVQFAFPKEETGNELIEAVEKRAAEKKR